MRGSTLHKKCFWVMSTPSTMKGMVDGTYFSLGARKRLRTDSTEACLDSSVWTTNNEIFLEINQTTKDDTFVALTFATVMCFLWSHWRHILWVFLLNICHFICCRTIPVLIEQVSFLFLRCWLFPFGSNLLLLGTVFGGCESSKILEISSYFRWIGHFVTIE